MKLGIFFTLVFCFYMSTSYAVKNQVNDCDDTAALADSLNFRKLHIDCAEENSKPSEKSDDSAAAAVAETSVVNSQSVSDPASIENTLRAEESFSLTGGPLAAQTQLFQSMAKACPKGWELLRQQVKVLSSHAVLQYHYRCL